MKQIYAVKKWLLIALLGTTGAANAQTFHPYAFNSIAGNTVANWYKDYVGTRLQVTVPTVIAGTKDFTTPNDGSGAAGVWGGFLSSPLVDVPIIMGSPDSFGCSSFPAGSMAGKIAVIWRGPAGGAACEFGYKALQAQNAGALACVIINHNPGEAPVGMAAGASGASVTIPVFMIGNLDGIAISGQYNSLPAGTVKMTITPWGQLYQNDLGFVPGGYSIWHNYATPASQFGTTNPLAYKGLNGAFLANYGTHNATNVKLKAGLSFTPTGGSAGTATWDSMSLASFPSIDSIWALYAPAEYDLPSTSGTGRYDLTYSITSDSTDQFSYDNSLTHSFYASDSVFSKGRYDFVEKHPLTTLYYSPGFNYMWGTPYYVSRAGFAMKDVQFSVSAGIGLLPAIPINFYIFKWVDGSFGTGSLDSLIEGGELQLVGTCIKTFDGTLDSSFGYFTTSKITGDSSLANPNMQVVFDSNSWYFVAADIYPPSSTQRMYLGCDGILNYYPRAFGREYYHNHPELYAPVLDTSKSDMRTYYQNAAFTQTVFWGGGSTIDSFVFSSQQGLIPNLALEMTAIGAPGPIDNSVNNTNMNKSKFEVFPNPATDFVNVTLELEATAKVISYTIIDGHARVVGRETHNNVKNDKFTYSTKNLPSGNYYVVATVDGKQVFKKFAVVR